MQTLGSWGVAIMESLNALWTNFVGFVPKLFGAILVIVLGILIAIGIARIIRRIINALKITALLKKTRIDEVVEKTGIKFDVGQFCYWLVKWFLIIVFFMAAAEIVNLPQVSQFLAKVLFYIPNVIVAVLIMFVGIILASFLAKVVRQSARATSISQASKFLSLLTRWSVLIFSLMAALIQLKVAVDLIRTLFTGFIAMVALAGGIAFGLGGKEEAKKLLGKITNFKNNRKEK